MKYENNNDIRRAVKREAAQHDLTLAGLAARLGWLPQELNNMFNKKHIAFDDLRPIAEALDSDLYFYFVPRLRDPQDVPPPAALLDQSPAPAPASATPGPDIYTKSI